MAEFKTHKFVAALPSELEADAIYFVRAGVGFDLYVTNHSGTIVAYPVNNDIDLSNYAPKNNPAFAGITSVPTVATADDSTKIASTEFVNNFFYDLVVPQLYETFATHVLLADLADATEQALGGKQDAIGFTPADATDTYTKGEVDAALVVKADSSSVTDLGDRVTGAEDRLDTLEAINPVLTVNGIEPDAEGNIVVAGGASIPSQITLDRVGGILTTITETVDGDPRITTLTRSNGVLTQTVTTYRGKTVTNTFNRMNGRLTGVTTTED